MKSHNKGIVVLSLFDGMSCGQMALKRAGVSVSQYFASEIDKYALQIAQKNFPKTIQLGDVKTVKAKNLPKIDLVIGGSPCQGFSYAGTQLNFQDPRSKLFFEFTRILKEVKQINPNVMFLLENVPMKAEYQNVITNCLGVEPEEINSNLFSAQNRNRIYWTNITKITKPKDKGILLEHIVHENVDMKVSAIAQNNKAHALTASYGSVIPSNSYNKKQRTMLFEELKEYVVPFEKTLEILDKEVKTGKVGYFRKDSQANRVYYINGKSVTLCGSSGGRDARTGFYLFGCITPDRVNKRQNGQRFNEGRKFYTLTAQDKHGILIEGYIRKLSPIECERLQTLPDNYTAGVSNSQRYKMLGNGWTIDVIVHILKNIKANAVPQIKSNINLDTKLSKARKRLKKLIAA